MQGLVIDGLDPVNWLMEQREYWQYRSGRFSDPELPSILSQVDFQKLQRFLAAYTEDERGLYLSDSRSRFDRNTLQADNLVSIPRAICRH